MRILLAHTYYKLPGGEDRVFAAEAALLRRNGHEVLEYCQHNDQTDSMSAPHMALRTIWSSSTYSELRGLVRRWQPDVCHFHNTFPVMSPSAFYAARSEAAAIVVTLHNYRLLCPAATLMRDGRPCEACVGALLPWRSVQHGCYRGSRGASATTAAMLSVHRIAGTWSRTVDTWIALTEFARGRFIAGGLPADRLVVKPNFIERDPGFSAERQDFALFVGRLSPEKGIDALLSAWRALRLPVRLRIAGDGPLRTQVLEAAAADPRIEYLGARSGAEVAGLMQKARLLVFPSIWYEGLPLTVIEAFAAGLPVVASRIGSLADLVSPGVTGLHFEPGNVSDLVDKLTSCWQNPDTCAAMGRRARSEYLAHYTADGNYRQLADIYQGAIHRRSLGYQGDGTHGTAVVDHVPAAGGRGGGSAAGCVVEAGERIALDNCAIHGAERVPVESDTLIEH